MYKNYFKIAFRILLKHKVHSGINILGLSIGMAVSMLIGLWLYDELNYNKSHQKYDDVAQVMFSCDYNHERIALAYNPYLMGEEIRSNYGAYFKHVVMSTFTSEHVLASGDNKFNKKGNFMEPEVVDILSIKMLKGSGKSLNDPSSILINESLAQAVYGDVNPIGRVLKIDNMQDVKVSGVYADIVVNSDFKDVSFIAPWNLYLIMDPTVKNDPKPWSSNRFQTFVQLKPAVKVSQVSAKLANLRVNKISPEEAATLKPIVFLYPMPRWHLYSALEETNNTHQRIEYVWLMGTIGVFVLLLACINFVNLSTARSENRAKEVGIRKTIGSNRRQLIYQFFCESLLAVGCAFILCIIWTLLALPSFNLIADKQMKIFWVSPLFWLINIAFSIATAFIAGIYPAMFLSSFHPVQVLKSTFKLGGLAALPRKILVVLQFTVSVVLIIGTVIIYRQINYAQSRPIGYDREGLITVAMKPDIQKNFIVIRDQLMADNVITGMAASVNTTTDFNAGDINFNWTGRDTRQSTGFAVSNVTDDYGKLISWQIKEGRDFSKEFLTDSTGFIINEAAAKIMGFKNPVGQAVEWKNKTFHIIGVIRNIIFESPYQAVTPSIFHMSGGKNMMVTIKINPRRNVSNAIEQIGQVFSRYNPAYPFDYKFVDAEYEKKFKDEILIGKLTSFFTVLAIFISCLGLFGMASFMAEQRTKEISIRKVLGASVLSLWMMLVKDFVLLVGIACVVSAPIAYLVMYKWLQNYQYRSDISFWIFLIADTGALTITLLTVSYQMLKTSLNTATSGLRS